MRHTLRGCVDWNIDGTEVSAAEDSHTLRGCVDWNVNNELVYDQTNCHTLRGCVDWNKATYRIASMPWCHTLRGCVDWNSNSESDTAPIWGHTLRGCVDWNEYVNYGDDNDMPSHPSWVCGLKQQNVAGQPSCSKVTPFVGVWIETTSTLWYTLIVKSHPSWVCGMKQKTDFIFWAHLKKSFLRKRAIDCQ